MAGQRFSHVVGFDDAPFDRALRGNVRVIGAVFAATRLEGIMTGWVRRDGGNATRVLAALVSASRFRPHLQLVMLQGIALAGFNVVDIGALSERTGLPVLVVARKRPDIAAIREALLERVPGGERKWRLIEKAGPMEPLAGVYVQRAGLSLEAAAETVARLTIHGRIPEPLRTAHIVAGGVAAGESKGRV